MLRRAFRRWRRSAAPRHNPAVREQITVACVQAEPVILDRDATIEKAAQVAREAKANGADLLVFPEAFIPAYPSSVWARALAGWADPDAKAAFSLLARESVEVPGPAVERLGEIARANEVWLVTGVTERDPERPGTLYNTLLYHAPDGRLAQRHRKLVPTNHERLVWGQGVDGGRRSGVAGDTRAHRARVALLRDRVVPLPARAHLPRRLPAAAAARRGR